MNDNGVDPPRCVGKKCLPLQGGRRTEQKNRIGTTRAAVEILCRKEGTSTRRADPQRIKRIEG